MSAHPSIAWVVPEEKGGIRTYAEELIPHLGSGARVYWEEAGIFGEKSAPTLIHIQHEFGIFGSKNPGSYRFPGFVKRLRKRFPGVPLVATGHTVLPKTFRYETRGKGLQAPLRMAVNASILPQLRKLWTNGTWGIVDGVIVHSALQVETLRDSGCRKFAVIPHFVPSFDVHDRVQPRDGAPKKAIVFGYFSPDKGQDIAIHAWAQLRITMGANLPKLELAGGVRRAADQGYFDKCAKMIQDLQLQNQVEITGYVPADRIRDRYLDADLVIAPFRETSGSGSLAQALGRGSVILASDLPLNLEISERIPGCLELFRAGDATDLAAAAHRLFASPLEQRLALSAAALRYANAYSPEKIAALHLGFYRTLAGVAG